jgi:hypothetical protein
MAIAWSASCCMARAPADLSSSIVDATGDVVHAVPYRADAYDHGISQAPSRGVRLVEVIKAVGSSGAIAQRGKERFNAN